MNKTGFFQPRRFTALLGLAGLLCAAPAVSLADPSDTSHASTTGSTNASANGVAHSNVNGLAAATDATAPVPETSTYVALGTLLAGAAFMYRRRRIAARA